MINIGNMFYTKVILVTVGSVADHFIAGKTKVILKSL